MISHSCLLVGCAHFSPSCAFLRHRYDTRYAAKVNGSLGYADTAAGEGNEGVLMEQFGFPALKKLGLKTIAMVYAFAPALYQKHASIPHSRLHSHTSTRSFIHTPTHRNVFAYTEKHVHTYQLGM